MATTTLDALEKATGYAATAGGTRLPIRDLIQMAGQARHYLAVFDNHHREVLYLGRAKRCATTAQRLALFARDIGCTRPGCTKAAFDCQAHHGDKPWPQADRPTSTNSPWPAPPTTQRSRTPVGPPAAATATPNGPHHPNSTPAKPASTTTTTPSATSKPRTAAVTTTSPNSAGTRSG
ncbi:DUF222 domain-containing protein [Mycobacterium sp. 852013-51886_SCH5428379]|uniref:DUF222 domain-containing protein n=1 Tax=Mycobacterium sp. 852013-51886_SCH5428379 TaxID=1834111 RepID=UPI0035175F27